MSVVPRKLGKLGEYTLDAWASSVGVISQPPQDDQTGWDRIVEIRTENWKGPIDKRPGVARAYIQIKSTDKRTRKWQIKLSNLESMVKTPEPAFYLFLEFDGRNDVQSAYLVHVDKNIMLRVLKRLRQADTDSDSDIHKMKLTMSYGDSHHLQTPDAKTLFNEINRVVGNIDEYSRKKLLLLNEIGYEDGIGVLNTKIMLPEKYKGLHTDQPIIDIALGLLKEFDVQQGSFTDNRFGILASQPHDKFKAAKASLQPESIESCRLILSGADGSKVEWQASLYTTLGFSHLLSGESHAIRTVTSFIEFLLFITSTEVTFEPKLSIFPDELYTLADYKRLQKTLQIIHETSESNQHIRLRIYPTSNNIPPLEEKVVLNLEPKTLVGLLIDLFESVIKIANKADIDFSELMTLRQMEDASGVIRQTRLLIKNGAMVANKKFKFSDVSLEQKEYLIIDAAPIYLEQKVIFVLTSVTGEPTKIEAESYEIQDACIDLFAIIVEDIGAFEKTHFEELVRERLDKQGNDLPVVLSLRDAKRR